MLLHGKVALVTGGARGLGRAIAELFAAEGAVSFAGDIVTPAKTASVKRGASVSSDGRPIPLKLDVTSEADWKSAIDEIESRHGGLDILVNNSGIVYFGNIEDTSLADYLRVINVNQIGTFLGMHYAIPAMKRRGAGSIVNISSAAGMEGNAGLVAYGASKWAVRGMTKVAAAELGKNLIRVNAILPGTIDTEMTRQASAAGNTRATEAFCARLPIQRLGDPLDIANAALFLASDKSTYLTGTDMVVDGGYLNARLAR